MHYADNLSHTTEWIINYTTAGIWPNPNRYKPVGAWSGCWLAFSIDISLCQTFLVLEDQKKFPTVKTIIHFH